MMDKFKTYTDDKLVQLLKSRELDAFEEIYRRYWKRLYSTCYKRLQSREISEELVQDIFTSLWATRSETTIDNLSAYLFTAARYKVINHVAREASRKTYSNEQLKAVREDNSTEEAVLLNDLHVAMEKAIGQLPHKRQLIYKMHGQGNLSLKQVASQLGISEKTVENQYGKAMKMLKVNLRNFTLALPFQVCVLSEYSEYF